MKFNLRKTFLFFLIASVFAAAVFAESSDSSADEQTTVTILNALKTSNVKDKEKDEDLILFEGLVKISVEKGQTKTIISADRISYSRKHEMLYAEGNVNMEQTDKSGSVSNIGATSVLFNTSTLEGIFDEGRIVQAETNSINLPSGSTLVVGSEVFARNHSGTIAFKNGELTFCNDKHPHWKIRATRIWLLPGNEFAFFNAVLWLDNIPVLYLPAFYYPKDELLFNPVFGFKNRNGFYIQTTTYLYGRKPLEPENSSAGSATTASDDDMSKYFNFIKPTKLMDQERQGLILHNLDTVYTGSTSDYLKIMADWYSNLGFATGFEGSYKPKKIFNQLEGGVLLGFGNTVFQSANAYNVYLPFDSAGDSHYEKSNFMGMELPFRYRANLKLGISTPVNLTLSMPIYSDPFFNYDYGDRSETMDWFSYLLNNPVAENSTITEQQKLDSAEITSFTWDLSGNYSLKIPEVLKPYVESVSISSFNSAVVFSSKLVDSPYLPSYDPSGRFTAQRKFFFPSQVTPLKTSLSINGSLISLGSTKTSSKSVSYPVELIPPEELSPEKKEDAEKKEEEKKEEKETSGFDFEKEGLAIIDFSPDSVSSINDFKYDLNYSINPEFVSQLNYAHQGLNKGSDFKWDRIQSSYIYVKVPVKFKDNLSVKNNFFTMNNTLDFTPVYQTHPYISTDTTTGGYQDSEIKSMKKADYTSSMMEVLNTNSLSIKPFTFYPNFKDTNITYNTSVKLLRTKFIGDADNPKWDTLTVDFNDEESITQHSLDLTLAANELGGDFKQSLTITSTLPPQVSKYYGTLKFEFPYVTLTGEAGVSQVSKTDSTWKKELLRQGFTFNFFNSKLNFTESYNYDVENSHPDSLKLALSYEGLQVSYLMQYTNPFDFTSTGWVQDTSTQEFLPKSASIAYTLPAKNFKAWKNRISVAPTLDTSLSIDFIRPTNSYFIFTPGITFRINKFLDISFSATSRNDVLYRYVQSALGHPGRIPGEENIFKDLANSFRFDDESLRKASGFKLKSLNFAITHDLHDWDLKCEFKIEPRLITPTTGMQYYDFSPYFTLSVVWRPMESMKTEILDDYGTWKLK